MQRPDTATVDTLHPRGHFVDNVTGLEHRSRLVFPILWCQPAADSLLAIPQHLGVSFVHSKWPFAGGYVRCNKHISTNIYGHFECFFASAPKITLVEGLDLLRRWLPRSG